MTSQEIAQMHFHSVGMSWDTLPAENASIEDIDFEKVRKYIKKANEAGRRRIGEDENLLRVLEKIELVREGKPVWAAVLLFHKGEKRFLSQARIHCGRFKGEVVLDDRMVGGTIIEQVGEAMDFIRKHMNVRFVMTGRPVREEIWDYPLEALREALVNAVCHRDYTIPSTTEVRVHDETLIIWNPGGLPFGITLEDLFSPHPSVLRNKGVGEIFYDMGLIEQWGSGIDKMQKACAKAGIPEPQFEEYQGGFKVTFRKDVYTGEYICNLGLNERGTRAVMYVKEKGRITNKEYQELTGVKERLATMELTDMVNKNILNRHGVTGRGTYYTLTTPRKLHERRTKDAE